MTAPLRIYTINYALKNQSTCNVTHTGCKSSRLSNVSVRKQFIVLWCNVNNKAMNNDHITAHLIWSITRMYYYNFTVTLALNVFIIS